MNQQSTDARSIPLELLEPSKTNPRTHFDADYIRSLAENFIEHTHAERGIHGIKQGLLVRPRDGGRFEIVSGECRYRGAKQAVEIATERDLPDVARLLAAAPCRVEELSDREVLEIQLVENLKRTDLTPVEEAKGYQRLLDLRDDGAPGYTVALIAKQVGKSERSIYEKLTLLRAPKAILDALETKAPGIGERHAVLLARIPDPQLREEAAKRVMEGASDFDGAVCLSRAMTVAETKALLREEYMVSLKGAPWKIDDEDLDAKAGPCAACPHLAKNFTELTDDLAQGSSGRGGKGGIDPLTCCNPVCRDRKMKAFFDREAKALKAAGGKVLSQKEARAIFYSHGGVIHSAPYVPVDAKPGYEVTGKWDDKNVPTYGQLAAKVDAKPTVTLAMSPKGEVVHLMDKKAAVQLAQTLKARGELKSSKKAPSPAEQREREKARRADRIAVRTKIVALRLLAEHIQKHPMGIEECYGRLKLALWHAGMDGCRLVCEWLGCKPEKPKKGCGQMAKDHAEAIVEHLVARGTALAELSAIEAVVRVAKEVKQWSWPPQSYDILAKAHGFDVKQVVAQATREIDAEAAAKAQKKTARNGPPAAKPPSKSKSASAARNAGVNDADERTRDKLAHEAPAEVGVDLSFDDQVAMARKGATWSEILGPRPKEGTPEFKSWTAQRVKVWKAAKKAKGTK